MALSDDIRGKTGDLLAFDLGVEEFEDWIATQTWNVHQDQDVAAAAPLAYKIELLLSELSGGYRSEYEFRAALARLFQTEWATFEVLQADLKPQVVSGANTALVGALS